MNIPNLYTLLIWKGNILKDKVSDDSYENFQSLLRDWELKISLESDLFYEVFSNDIYGNQTLVSFGPMTMDQKAKLINQQNLDSERPYFTIWDSNPEFHSWRVDNASLYPGYGVFSLRKKFNELIEKKKRELQQRFKTEIKRPILLLADIESADGRYFIHKELDSASEIFDSFLIDEKAHSVNSTLQVYVNKNGQLRGVEYHQNGENYYRFLIWNNSVTEKEKQEALCIFKNAKSVNVDLSKFSVDMGTMACMIAYPGVTT